MKMVQLMLPLVLVCFSVIRCVNAEIASKPNQVSVNMGLNDAEAVVGRIFRYTIPKDAFEGQVEFYEVTEAGGATLQNWLLWHPERQELTGIPDEQDSGPNYIQVTAVGLNTSVKDNSRLGGKAKDVFSIHVSDEHRQQNKPIPLDERISYDHGSSTVMTLIFDVDTDQLSTQEKIKLVDKVSSNFGLNPGAIRLFSTVHDSYNALKRTILVAGAAPSANSSITDQEFSSSNRAVIMWRLNCDSSVPSRENSFALDWMISAEEKVGYVERTLGYPLRTWYVATISYELKRRRRQSSNVTPNSRGGPTTGGPYGIDVTVANIPTRTQASTRTPTVRIRPTGFVNGSGVNWTAVTATKGSQRPSGSGRTRTRGTVRPTTTIANTLVTRKPGDSRPMVTNSLGVLRCRQNTVCYIPIPADTFHDAEDGDTSKLTLRLDPSGESRKHPPWLRLDETHQRLLGLPIQPGNFPFRLTAVDSGNRHSSDAFSIDVKADTTNERKLSHRIWFHFTVPNEKNFTRDVKYRIYLIQKIAQYYGDPTAEKIRVNLLKEENGEHVLSWSNISLTTDRCPRKVVENIFHRLLREDGQVRMQLKRFMDPAFLIRKVNVEYGGACVGDGKGAGKHFPGGAATETVPESSSPSSAASEENFFISTILPAIIITVFLILAMLIACLLYRKNQQHKKAPIEPKSEFVSKGTPVIFPDEIEYDKESTAGTPMLLKDEKPPLQPMDVLEEREEVEKGRRGDGNGADAGATRSTPVSVKTPSTVGPGKVRLGEVETEMWQQRPLLHDADENPLYRPPPAFEPAGTKENRSPRPKHAGPQQRDPPPYVPP